MKQRIMSRKEIATIHLQKMNGLEVDYDRLEKAMKDMLFYVIADGQTVKVYNDTNMGGAVVEIVE